MALRPATPEELQSLQQQPKTLRPATPEELSALSTQPASPVEQPTTEQPTGISGFFKQLPENYKVGAQELFGQYADIPTKLVHGATFGYLPAVETPAEAGIPRRIAGTAAELAGMGLGLFATRGIPLLKGITTPVGKGIIGGAISAAKPLAFYEAARAREQGETAGRIETGLKGGLTGAIFGAAGGILEPLIAKLPWFETARTAILKRKQGLELLPDESKAISKLHSLVITPMLGAGAGATEPAKDMEERIANIAVGAGGFALAEKAAPEKLLTNTISKIIGTIKKPEIAPRVPTEGKVFRPVPKEEIPVEIKQKIEPIEEVPTEKLPPLPTKPLSPIEIDAFIKGKSVSDLVLERKAKERQAEINKTFEGAGKGAKSITESQILERKAKKEGTVFNIPGTEPTKNLLEPKKVIPETVPTREPVKFYIPESKKYITENIPVQKDLIGGAKPEEIKPTPITEPIPTITEKPIPPMEMAKPAPIAPPLPITPIPPIEPIPIPKPTVPTPVEMKAISKERVIETSRKLFEPQINKVEEQINEKNKQLAYAKEYLKDVKAGIEPTGERPVKSITDLNKEIEELKIGKGAIQARWDARLELEGIKKPEEKLVSMEKGGGPITPVTLRPEPIPTREGVSALGTLLEPVAKKGPEYDKFKEDVAKKVEEFKGLSVEDIKNKIITEEIAKIPEEVKKGIENIPDFVIERPQDNTPENREILRRDITLKEGGKVAPGVIKELEIGIKGAWEKDYKNALSNLDITAKQKGWDNLKLNTEKEKVRVDFENNKNGLNNALKTIETTPKPFPKERRIFLSPEEWKAKYLPELNRLWGMKEAGIKPEKIITPKETAKKPITSENIEDTLDKILNGGKGEFIGDAVTIYDEKLKIDPSFPEEKTIKEVSDIVDKITGGTAKIELVPTIPVSEEGLTRHGFKSANLKNMKFTVLGRTRILSRNEFKSLVKLTYSHPEIEATAAHEGFHVASEMFLDKTRNNILKDYFSKGGKNWKEAAADAFSDFYMKGKEGKESSTIKNIFNRIGSFFSQLKNGLMGKGFNSIDSIFKEIATGKTAKEAIEKKESDIKTKVESKPMDIDMLDSVKIEPKGLTEVIDVIKREGIRSKFEKRIREDMGKLGTYFASPYAVSKKYDKFKKAFDRFMYGTEVAEESLVKMLEMNKGYYSLSEGSKSKVGKVMIESDKNGKPFTTEELKKRGFNNEEISAYWANKKATDFTISERHRRIVKDSLLYDYQNEKWMDSYINDFLYGDHRQSLDSFKKKMESKLTKEEIKDMIEFHEKNPLVTERQVFERDSSGNIVVDENGKPKYTTKHLYDEISDLKGFLKSTYYFPRTYGDGKYFARVVQVSPDGSKNTVWRNNTEWKVLRKIEERDWSKIIDEGVKRANELNSKAKKGYKFVVEKGEIEESLTDIYPHITKEALTKFTESALLSIKEKGKVDPGLSKEFSSTMLDALHKDILARGSVTKHFIQREKYQTMSGEEVGVEGYKTDKPDQIYAQYFKQMANNFSKLSFTTPAYKMLSQIDVQMQPELYKYTKRWIQDMLTPGNKMDRAVSIFKHIAFGTYMGFNLRPAAIQMTQNLIGGLPILSRHIAEGLGKPKAHAQSDILAHNYMFKAAKDLAFNIKDIEKNNKLSKEEKMAMKELYQKGYTRAQYLNQLLGETMGKYGSRMQKFQSAMGWLFAQAEAYNRYTAGLARYRAGRNIDKVSHDEAVKRAEGFISDVHFVYGVHNLPQIIRGQGVMPSLGRMAYTFRSFTQYFVESMVNYGKDKEGKVALDVAFRSLAYMALLGGIAGLPFVDDVLDTYESKTGTPIREQMGNMFGNPDSVLRLGVENGLPAALLGIDISSSVQINIPKNPEDALVGVYGSIGNKFTKAAQQLEYGNWTKAVESMSPLFIENPLKAARMLKEGATTVTGSIRYQETGEPLKFSDTDALLQGMGLKPVELSRMQKVERISKNLENFYRKQRENIAVRVRESRDNLDMSDIMERVNSYNEKAAKFNGAIPLITSKNFKSYLAEDKPNKTLLWLGMEANVNEEEKTAEETTNAE
jgi:hypothetical protein